MVSAPPVLGQVSPSFLIQKKGDTVEMYCEASANPDPTLLWYKDGKVRRGHCFSLSLSALGRVLIIYILSL